MPYVSKFEHLNKSCRLEILLMKYSVVLKFKIIDNLG